MIARYLFRLSIIVTGVAAFAPSASRNFVPTGEKNVISNKVFEQKLVIQPRKKNLQLSAVLESGMDPMITTLILGAALMASMSLNPDDEIEAISSSAKSLVADSTKKEEPEAVKEQTVAAVTEVEETKVEPVEAELEDLVTKAETTEDIEVNNQAPVEEEAIVEPSIDMEAERKKLEKIMKIYHSEPEAESAIDTGSPFALKLIGKLVMPWRKFSNI